MEILTETDTLNDSSGKGVQAAIDNVGDEGEKEEEPGFGVEYRLNHLVSFEVTVDHPRLIPPNTGDGGKPFLVVEEPGGDGGVGEGEEEHDAPARSE